MATIDISHAAGNDWTVEVRDDSGSTRHTVEVTPDALARYGGGAEAEDLLRESFRFLLEREPKEAILRRFEISVIERYFPEYPDEIRRRLGA